MPLIAFRAVVPFEFIKKFYWCIFIHRKEEKVEDLVLKEAKLLDEVTKGKVSVEAGHIFNLKEVRHHSIDLSPSTD